VLEAGPQCGNVQDAGNCSQMCWTEPGGGTMAGDCTIFPAGFDAANLVLTWNAEVL
jgi:hypothetical protein